MSSLQIFLSTPQQFPAFLAFKSVQGPGKKPCSSSMCLVIICDGQSLKLKTVGGMWPCQKFRFFLENEVVGTIHGGWNSLGPGNLTIDQYIPKTWRQTLSTIRTLYWVYYRKSRFHGCAMSIHQRSYLNMTQNCRLG